MINNSILRWANKRKLLKGSWPELPKDTLEDAEYSKIWPSLSILAGTVGLWVIIAGFALCGGCRVAHASMTPRQWEELRLLHKGVSAELATQAIIGEAEAEGFEGMVAIAHAIRNRGNLKGVYGLNSPRVIKRLYNTRSWYEAKAAWEASYNGYDMTNGATGWGNASDIEIFKRHSWWKNCVVTAKIGNHWFYKEVKL